MILQLGVKALHELNRRGVDAAAAAVQDDGVAVLEAADHEDVEKGGDVRFADAGGFFEAHAGRDGHQVAGIGHGIFGIAAAADQGHDPVADLAVGDAGAEFGDGSRPLPGRGSRNRPAAADSCRPAAPDPDG